MPPKSDVMTARSPLWILQVLVNCTVVLRLIVVVATTMMYLGCALALLSLALLLDLAAASDDDCAFVIGKCQFFAVTAALVLAAIPGAGLGMDSSDEEAGPKRRRGHRDKARFRVRRSISSIFREYGPYYVRRAYRMTQAAFWDLHTKLEPHMTTIRSSGSAKRKKLHRNGSKNGLIPTEICLSAAIRYFAGGRPEDIAISHGISHSEVFYSCWKVVDAVNKCPDLAFSYPECHEKQKELALAFQAKSAAGIDCCAGAVDGMLLWIERPTAADCELAHCGSKKFFCGRKHKFGLNMQATCDAEGKFLDVSIGHSASTSDFLAFSTSKFQKKIEMPGFLAPGLCIFGDLAYVNNGYFMTPFKSVKSGIKDTFNFYHSQLRINIECAFGMFVGRWGILRKALPKAMGLRKIAALTLCLCRLHNFCLAANSDGVNKKLLAPLASDNVEIIGHGGVDLSRNGLEQLLHGGGHHDDTSRVYRQGFRRAGVLVDGHCPRDRIIASLESSGMQRPTPKSWKAVSGA
jgi:DDE superfamily endonuclease